MISSLPAFQTNEKYVSQIPALQLLIALGYTYLSPEQTLAMRGGKRGNVILEDLLRDQLKHINRIRTKGRTYLFSEENIQTAIQRLKSVKYDGLVKTNEAVYDLLTLGVSLEQSLEGDLKSYTLNYIDWKHPANNVYHVTAEFAVERTRSHESCRPDIVLFVNGIPFAVIECKAPSEDVAQAVSQHIRNQKDDYIPRLFSTVQLLVALNKNAAKYGTVGTPAKFWAVWKEEMDEAPLQAALDTPMPMQAKAQLYELLTGYLGLREDRVEYLTRRAISPQDQALYCLCRPERLLDLALRFSVFEGGVRKIARYQQYFAILKILQRVKQIGLDGRRMGGIIGHTTGSGKSLTMVMLARALALDPDISNPRIVLVTDRTDLDRQLAHTFAASGLLPQRARTANHLVELLKGDQAALVTTLVHKFGRTPRDFRDDSPNVFVLVDESHRTQLGSFATEMRRLFPNACYLGYTGTPLMRKEKRALSEKKFGSLIDVYPIGQAVTDGAVVPLLYEGRHVEMEQNRHAIDTWFERHTQGLTDEQCADLKRKYSRAEMLNKADQVIYMRAFDISEHYRANWQGTGLKAQLVAPSKLAALKYKQHLDEIGHVTSAVVISPPDTREGHEEIDTKPTDEVVTFWERMMRRYGSEEEYNKQVIAAFQHGEEPEILIVVDKLLTGFDAPRNTVLYLTRPLREHSLLQAIARVNRLYEGENDGPAVKTHGYVIDYAGVLADLDAALSTYNALTDFDEEDLQGTISSINTEVTKLPQRHAELWDLFKEIRNKGDEEAFEQLLADDALRETFYERLADFARTLGIALSSEQFIANTPERRIMAYKTDLKRFSQLRTSVKLRYAESIDYRDYEPKIKKLLDTHISASEVIRLNEPVDIFDQQAFQRVIEASGDDMTTASKADTIAHATKKAIAERLEQDPAFYRKFSQLIQETIDDFRAKRLSDIEYWQRVLEIKEAVVNRKHEPVPAAVRGNDDATALFGVLTTVLAEHAGALPDADDTVAKFAADIWVIIQRSKKVGFWDDLDAQRAVKNQIDDYLYDVVREANGVPLTTAEMDDVIERTLRLARYRMVLG